MSFNYNSTFICKQASGNMKWVKDDKDFIDKCIQEEGEAGRLLASSPGHSPPGVAWGQG